MAVFLEFFTKWLKKRTEYKIKKTIIMKTRTIVITGASAGVGRAVAREFAKEKSNILLIARGEERLLATKKEVESLGGKAWIFSADVAKPQEVEAAAEYAEQNIGAIDIWINNAMVSVFSRAVDMKPDEFLRVTEVTYLGQVYGTIAALKKMKTRNRGKIILIGSALSFRGIPLQSAYCASKHALQGFFESLRAELIHDKVNVSLSIIHLPALNTPQFSWVKTRFSYKPKPMGQIFQPEVAAREIIKLADSKARLRLVGFSTFKTIWGNRIVPEFLDYYLAKTAFRGQFTEEKENPNRKNNLWTSPNANVAAHGSFDNQAQDYSIYNKISNHKYSLLFLIGLIIGSALRRKGILSEK